MPEPLLFAYAIAAVFSCPRHGSYLSYINFRSDRPEKQCTHIFFGYAFFVVVVFFFLFFVFLFFFCFFFFCFFFFVSTVSFCRD